MTKFESAFPSGQHMKVISGVQNSSNLAEEWEEKQCISNISHLQGPTTSGVVTSITLRRSHQGLPQEAPLKSLGIGDLFGVHVFLDLSFSDRLSAGRKEYAKHSMSIFKVLEERVLSISCVYHTNSEL